MNSLLKRIFWVCITVGSFFLLKFLTQEGATGYLINLGTLSLKNLKTVKISESQVLFLEGFHFVDASQKQPSEQRAQVFDATTQTFQDVGSLKVTGRDYFETTLMNNGKVLILGGRGHYFDNPITQAEIYDPDKKEFFLTGKLIHPRTNFKLANLPNGKVLIVGGSIGGRESYVAPASTELFDPVTGKFTLGPKLHEPRTNLFLFPLPSGDVIIAGGSRYDLYQNPKERRVGMRLVESIQTIELYKYKSNQIVKLKLHKTFDTNPVDPDFPKFNGSYKFLANGDLLLFIQGMTIDPGKGRLQPMVLRYRHETHDIETVLGGNYINEIFLSDGSTLSVKKKSWKSRVDPLLETLHYERYGYEKVMLSDGKVLILGGTDGTLFGCYPFGCPVKQLELYDPTNQTSRVIGTLKGDQKPDEVVPLASGQALIVGADSKMQNVYLYTPLVVRK